MFRKWNDLSLEDVDLILNDQKDLYTTQELAELREYRKHLVYNKRMGQSDAIPCPKCDGPNAISNTKCEFCGHILNEESVPSPKSDTSLGRLIFGFLFTGGGVFSVIHGNNLNNSVEAQWESYWNDGMTDPGTAWIIIGAALGIVGIIMLISAFFHHD